MKPYNHVTSPNRDEVRKIRPRVCGRRWRKRESGNKFATSRSRTNMPAAVRVPSEFVDAHSPLLRKRDIMSREMLRIATGPSPPRAKVPSDFNRSIIVGQPF
jgi:hypothetical protein